MSTSLISASDLLAEVFELLDNQLRALASKHAADVITLRKAIADVPGLTDDGRQILIDNLTTLELTGGHLATFVRLHPEGDDTLFDQTARRRRTSDVNTAGVLANSQAVLDEYRFMQDMALLAFVHAPDAIIVADSNGIIRLANVAAEALTGYRLDDLRDSPVEMLIPSDRRDRHRGLRNHYFDDPRPRPMGVGLDLVAQLANGSQVRMDINLAPVMIRSQSHVIITMRPMRSSSHR